MTSATATATPLGAFERLDRMQTIARYLGRLIESIADDLVIIAERPDDVGASSLAATDGLDSAAIGREYLRELNELIERGYPETVGNCR